MYCFVFFNHFDPNGTAVVRVADEDFKKAKEIQNKFGTCTQYVKVPITSSLIYFEHSDEEGATIALPFNNIKALERKLEQQLKNGDVMSREGNELEIDTVIGPYYRDLKVSPWKDAVEARNDMIGQIKDSFIDGDSSSARCVFNFKTGQVEWVGFMDVTFYESFDDFLKSLDQE